MKKHPQIYWLSKPKPNPFQPSYLSDFLSQYIQNRPNLRSEDKFLLTEPRTKLIAGEKAFYAAAPRLWNSLPTSLRQCSTTDKFKKALKFHLFPQLWSPVRPHDAIVFILFFYLAYNLLASLLCLIFLCLFIHYLLYCSISLGSCISYHCWCLFLMLYYYLYYVKYCTALRTIWIGA